MDVPPTIPALAAAAACAMTADAGGDLPRLAARARAGDVAAFGELVDLHHQAARRVALAALGNLADADEAVQDACVTAWQRLADLEDPAAFRAWLLRITWRKALDRRRSLGSLWRRLVSRDDPATVEIDAHVDPGAGPSETFEARERDRAIARAIRSLPSRLRDPLLLVAAGHRYEDVAALVGAPVGTVKWRVSEARRLTRQKLVRLGYGDPS